MSKDKKYYFHDSPQQFARDDFWRQVNRTIQGKPVDQQQINMIVSSIKQGLEISNKDKLLDLCCGNGALTSLIFELCNGGRGVDFSEYLIGVANEYFVNNDLQKFTYEDVITYCRENNGDEFNKILCYGAFSYFNEIDAITLLSSIKNNFVNVSHIYIGNCPDKKYREKFFKLRGLELVAQEGENTAIGIWRTEKEMIKIANDSGWKAEIVKMSTEYHASYYKFDVILTPNN